jgi:hypothetical protein
MANEGLPAPVTRRERRFVAGAAAALGLFYFTFRSQNHAIDAVLYALATDVKDAYPFFHWHHLLYTPATWLVVNAARFLGYGGDAFAPMAAVSAAATAAAAAFFYSAVRRLGGSVAAASLAAAFLSLSSAWWYFAGEAEILALISLFMAGALYLLARRDPNARGALLLASWLGVGTLFHQAVTLFVPVSVVILAWERRGRLSRLAAFSFAYAAVVFVPYLLVPRFYYGVRGWGEWFRWITFYYTWGDWGYVTEERVARGFVTALAAAVAGPDAFDVGKAVSFTRVLAAYIPAAFVLAGALAIIARAAPVLWRRRRRWLVAAGIWFLTIYSFATWWEPENVEWAIAATLPFWFVFGLAAPRGRAFYAAAICVLAGAAGLNWARLIYPAAVPGNNEAEAAARAIVAETEPGDVIFISHLDVNAWADYLGKHTRRLYAPFTKAHAAGARVFEAAAAGGFAEYVTDGAGLYFTDYEWDDRAPGNPGAKEDMKVVFFKILRRAEPLAVIRFPGGARVLFRFEGSAARLRDVVIYEAEREAANTEYALLATTGASAVFDIDIAARDRFVLCFQAKGVYAGGEWPVMEVAVDGVPIGRTVVDTPYWRFYETELALPRGKYSVRATFCNDYFGPAAAGDRDLFLNRVIVYRRGLSGSAGEPG